MNVKFFELLKDKKLFRIKGNVEMIKEDIVKFEKTLKEYEYVLPLIPEDFEMKKRIEEEYQLRQSIYSALTSEVARLESLSTLKLVPKRG